MRQHSYTEDLFIDFVETVEREFYSLQYQDRSAAHSFHTALVDGRHLTEKQAQYVLKILFKYRKTVGKELDYANHMEMPQWKHPFRQIDNSKKVWIETVGKTPAIVLKFPFGFKQEFDDFIKEIRYNTDYKKNQWDAERKVRLLGFYDYNVLLLKEFLVNAGFELSLEFHDAVDRVEEIFQDQTEYVKRCKVVEGSVELVNPSESAEIYFRRNKTTSLDNNLILAKSLGHTLHQKTGKLSIAKKIASTPSNAFWIKDLAEFIKLGYLVNGRIGIILDRTSQAGTWLEDLLETIAINNFNKSDFRVCFRAGKHDDPKFNNWVRDNGLGGKIDGAKFLIFNQKPPKWLYKDENDVIILASNQLFAPTNTMARHLFKNHNCVVYVGDIQPTRDQREEDLIEL
tara:strand:- start:6270 stop:7466 length:1197 start_codon:yes stop_codon:yes gene_type:complete